jgi:hypothetical protein
MLLQNKFFDGTGISTLTHVVRAFADQVCRCNDILHSLGPTNRRGHSTCHFLSEHQDAWMCRQVAGQPVRHQKACALRQLNSSPVKTFSGMPRRSCKTVVKGCPCRFFQSRSRSCPASCNMTHCPATPGPVCYCSRRLMMVPGVGDAVRRPVLLPHDQPASAESGKSSRQQCPAKKLPQAERVPCSNAAGRKVWARRAQSPHRRVVWEQSNEGRRRPTIRGRPLRQPSNHPLCQKPRARYGQRH